MGSKLQTVIMAGGFGRRAAGIDDSVPKPLISISGKPILLWEIECLARQGYTDIILTLSYKAKMIQDYFGDGSEFGCHISYFIEDSPLGNAGALFKLWQSGAIADDFILLNADSMFDVDFDRMVEYHKRNKAFATLFTHPNNHPYDSGLIVADSDGKDGKVTSWLTKEDERPKYYKNCVNAGIHIINSELLILSGISPDEVGVEPGQRKVDLDRDILKPQVTSGRIYSYYSPEYVKDMGTPERFKQVKQDLESGMVASRNLSSPQKAIFLDRDGTINKYVGFLRSIDEFEFLPGVAEAVQKINISGYLAIVVTNQPVIARGEVTEGELNIIHNKMETLLGNEGAYVDAIYYCPHHPDRGFEGEVKELKIDCDCRKPKPGMLIKASKDFNIDLSQSWMVGDSKSDVRAGINAGCRTALIGEGDFGQDVTCDSLEEFVRVMGL